MRRYTSAVGKPSNPSPHVTSTKTRPSAVVGHPSSMGKLVTAKTQSWAHPHKNNQPSTSHTRTTPRFVVAVVVRIRSGSVGSSPRMARSLLMG